MDKGSTSIMAIIADWEFLNDLDKCELKAFVTVPFIKLRAKNMDSFLRNWQPQRDASISEDGDPYGIAGTSEYG